MPEYGQPVDTDEEARKRKAAENPLVQYFSGQPKPAIEGAPRAPAPAPGAPPPTNTGTAANVPPPQQPGPTNFTNFSRVQSANRDVSTREARAYGQRATNKANAAAGSLSALRARFGEGVAGGSVGAPGPAQDGLMHLDPMSGLPLTGAEGMTSDELYAKGAGSYTGPGGLGDIEGVDDTYAKTLAAQQNLSAVGDDAGGMQALIQEQGQGGEGTSKLSASLIGSAGRKNFDALRARFNPEGDIGQAEKDAAAQATAAGEASTKNASSWRALGDTRKGEEDAAAADAARRKAEAAAADKAKLSDAELDAAFEKAQQSTLGDEANLAFNEFNKVMSPVNWFTEAAGVRDPTQDYLTKAIHPHGGDASGSTSGVKIQWRPEDKAVYKQMTPEQWQFLNSKTPTMQRLWIQMRGDQLAHRRAFAPGLPPPPGWEKGTGLP